MKYKVVYMYINTKFKAIKSTYVTLLIKGIGKLIAVGRVDTTEHG